MQQALLIVLFFVLLTAPQISVAQTCGALMLVPRSDAFSPEAGELESEARIIVLTEYAQLLERMSVSRQRVQALRRALLGESESLELPDDLVARLLGLSLQQKKALIEILKSKHPSQSSFAQFLEGAFAHDTLDRTSCRRILSSYARFFHLSQDIEAVQKPEGNLDLKKLLITGRLATEVEVQAGRPLLKLERVKMDQVSEIRYVVYRDYRGQARMRLSLITKYGHELNWGNRSPLFTALGEEVLSTGRLDISRRGLVRAADRNGSTFSQSKFSDAELTTLFKEEFRLKALILSH